MIFHNTVFRNSETRIDCFRILSRNSETTDNCFETLFRNETIVHLFLCFITDLCFLGSSIQCITVGPELSNYRYYPEMMAVTENCYTNKTHADNTSDKTHHVENSWDYFLRSLIST